MASAVPSLQEELAVASHGMGNTGDSVPQDDPREEAVDKEVTRVEKQVPAARAKGGIVLEADTLKLTTLRRSSRSKAKADEHTLQKTERLAAKKTLNLQVLLLPAFQILVLF